jgi:hypothetical protein
MHAQMTVSQAPMLQKVSPARFDIPLYRLTTSSKDHRTSCRPLRTRCTTHTPVSTCAQDSAFNKPKLSKICGHLFDVPI